MDSFSVNRSFVIVKMNPRNGLTAGSRSSRREPSPIAAEFLVEFDPGISTRAEVVPSIAPHNGRLQRNRSQSRVRAVIDSA